MYLIWDQVSHSSGWLWTQYIAKHDSELLYLLTLPPKCWGYRHDRPHWVYVVLQAVPGLPHSTNWAIDQPSMTAISHPSLYWFWSWAFYSNLQFFLKKMAFIFLLINFKGFICFGFYVWVPLWVYTHHVLAGAFRVQKRGSDTLDLELQGRATHCVC